MNLKEIGLIDYRNESLWHDLNETHSITINLTNYQNYACDSSNNNSTVIVPENNIDIDSFTHEILHILIRQKGLFFGSSFQNLVLENQTLSQIISDELIEHIANCIDHIKMLPIYLDLGFDKKKFIIDYDVNKCTKSEIKQLKENFKIRGNYLGEAVDFYIAKYIAIKADPKQHINYPKALIELKNIDSKLFGILENCITDWIKMPLESDDILDDDYRSISFEFYQNLCDWTEGKKFI